MNPIRVVAVIPTWNRRALLKKALRGVAAQVLPVDELVILDNASSDGTAEAIEQFRAQFPKLAVRVLREATNIGAAPAMAKLIAEGLRVGADWVWILDDDGEPTPTALTNLLAAEVATAPDTGILMPQVQEPGDRRWMPARFDPRKFSFDGVGEGVFARGAPIEVHTGGYNGMLVHRRAVETVGLPRSDFFLWFDDVEFVIRVTRHWKAWLVPSAVVWHRPSYVIPEKKIWPFSAALPDFPSEIAWRSYYMTRNQLILARLYSPPRRWLRLFLTASLREIAKPVLLNQDQKPLRWGYGLLAVAHALLGRLGAPVSPPIRKM